MRAFASKYSVVLMIMAMRGSVMASKFALTLFIARYLDLSSLGLYSLTAGAIAIAPIVVHAGMSHLIMRNAVTASTEELTDSLRHYWTFVTAAYATLFALSIGCTFVFDTSILWVVVVGVMFFEHTGNDVFYLYSNIQHHMSANAIAFLRGTAWILCYIPLALWDAKFRTLPYLFGFWLAGGFLAIMLFVCLSWSWPWKAAFSRPFKPATIMATMRKSVLFWVSDLSFIASQYTDRYLVTLFLGIKAAGIYFLFWTVANSTTTFLAMVLQQKQRPLLIHAYRTGGRAEHSQLAWHFLQTSTLATIALSVAIGIVFQILLPWLGQPALAGHWSAFWLIIAGTVVRYAADFEGMGLFTAHRDRMSTVTTVVSVVVLVIAQLLLLPILGLHGAGVAIMVTFLGIALWRYWLLFGSSFAHSESRQVRVPLGSPER